jgi:hypothetical protein
LPGKDDLNTIFLCSHEGWIQEHDPGPEEQEEEHGYVARPSLLVDLGGVDLEDLKEEFHQIDADEQQQ